MPAERAALRLADLAPRRSQAATTRFVNLPVPESVLEGIDRLVAEVGCTKTEAVAALLNEGLDTLDEMLATWTPPTPGARKRRGRPARWKGNGKC